MTTASDVLNAIETLRATLAAIPALTERPTILPLRHERARVLRLAAVHEAVDCLLNQPELCAEFYRLSVLSGTREDLVSTERFEAACAEVCRLADDPIGQIFEAVRSLGEADQRGSSFHRAALMEERARHLHRLKERAAWLGAL